MNNPKNLTKVLLSCGIIAGPLYITLGLLQALNRPGFDITRHDLSLLSIGNLGWIQITNFIVCGSLTIAAAIGMKRALQFGKGKIWGPLLIGLYGLGLIGAGIFVADPMNGFPAGLPSGTISAHGLMHFVTGGIGFLGLIISCFIFTRRFALEKSFGWVLYSLSTGIIYFLAFFGIAIGSQQGGVALIVVTLGFWVAVILGWSWIATLSSKLLKDNRIEQINS